MTYWGSELVARGPTAELEQCRRLSSPLTGKYTASEWSSALSLSTENVSIFRETCKDKVLELGSSVLPDLDLKDL